MRKPECTLYQVALLILVLLFPMTDCRNTIASERQEWNSLKDEIKAADGSVYFRCKINDDIERLILKAFGYFSVDLGAPFDLGVSLDLGTPFELINHLEEIFEPYGSARSLWFMPEYGSAIIPADLLEKFPESETVEYIAFINTVYKNDMFSQFLKYPNLSRLRLTDCKTSFENIYLLSKLEKLRKLEITSQYLSDVEIKHISEIPALEILRLDYVDLVNKDLSPLTYCDSLKKISFYGSEITDKEIEPLLKRKLFEVLILARTSITDASLPSIVENSTRYLDLSRTKITDEGVNILCKCNAVKDLYLDDTAISDSSIQSLSKMKNLKSLSIIDTAISSEGVNFLRDALKKTYITDKISYGCRFNIEME